MRVYDVHEALYQICEIHGPESRVRTLGQDQYGHIMKMYLIVFVSRYTYRNDTLNIRKQHRLFKI